MCEGKEKTGFCKEIAQVSAEAVLQETPQWQDVSVWGCPVCQKILHDVMDGIWAGERPIWGMKSHLTLCWEALVVINNRVQKVGLPGMLCLSHSSVVVEDILVIS